MTKMSFIILVIIFLGLGQLALLVAALIHILTHNTYRTGSQLIWILLCIFLTIIGPILYFLIGRGDE